MIHKAIKDFEDYLVSDTGEVYSLKSQKYLRAMKNTSGYLQVDLRKNNKTYMKLVHRLVAEAFIENPKNKPTVDHINRIRSDNRVENLRWASHFEQTENSTMVQTVKEKRGVPIIEIINDEVSVKYLSLSEVPDIDHRVLGYHIRKGETDFYVKQHNRKVRHFKVGKERRK